MFRKKKLKVDLPYKLEPAPLDASLADLKGKISDTHHPTSLFQGFLLFIGQGAMQYPKKCGTCGTPTKGNKITGFKFSCNCVRRGFIS